jgi:uncharacterized membrane protein
MAKQGGDTQDRRLVQWILRTGLAIALVLFVVGIGVDVATGVNDAPAVALSEILTIPLVGERLMALGVLVLGLTPGVRVLVLLVLWTRERDYLFAAVAAIVVVLLVCAAALGGG